MAGLSRKPGRKWAVKGRLYAAEGAAAIRLATWPGPPLCALAPKRGDSGARADKSGTGKSGFRMSASVFISYASQDQKVANTLCKALEGRGFSCWIASRNIAPGENFQIAIVRAIRIENNFFRTTWHSSPVQQQPIES